MAFRDIVHMHDVQPGIDESRHPAGGGIQDHASGWGWLDVARAHGSGGVDDHDILSLPGEVQHRLFRAVFRPFVDADQPGFLHRCGFVRRRAIRVQAESGDRAAINATFDPGGCRGAQHGHRAVQIGPQHRLRIRHPDAVIGGDMRQIATARNGAGERCGVGQVADDDFDVQTGQIPPVAGGANHHPHLMTARQQHPRDSGADKAGGSRYQGRTMVGQRL